MKYKILIDTREKFPYSFFRHNSEIVKLDIGDYTIEGMEDILCIERKSSVSEFAGWITQKKSKKQIEKMQEYQFKYLVLEFTLEDVFKYPVGSGIPKKAWSKLRVKSKFLASELLRLSSLGIEICYCSDRTNAENRVLNIIDNAYKTWKTG